MHFRRGDIVTVPFPFSDQIDGKARPAVVISNSIVNKTPDIILAAISTKIRSDEFSFFLDSNAVTRDLPEHSEVRCHKLFLAEKQLVKQKISSIRPAEYAKIFEKIMELLAADTEPGNA